MMGVWSWRWGAADLDKSLTMHQTAVKACRKHPIEHINGINLQQPGGLLDKKLQMVNLNMRSCDCLLASWSQDVSWSLKCCLLMYTQEDDGQQHFILRPGNPLS